MDRDQRWDRVERAYSAICDGVSPHHATSAIAALTEAYERGESDEFVKPTVIGEPRPMQDGDVAIFMNFRADRARELTSALTDPAFAGFERKRFPKLASFVCLSYYGDAYAALPVAFRNDAIVNDLGAVLETNGLTQLRIAETEKYAHVTYFFSGGREQRTRAKSASWCPRPRSKPTICNRR